MTTRPVHARVLGRLFPRSRYGPRWYRLGEFVTFCTDGFAAAETIPLLMLRHYHETRYLREWMTALGRKGGADRPFRRTLEIGCGFGRLSPYIADFSSEPIALDINGEALRTAAPMYPGIRFMEGSATEIPLPDASVDLLITWTVLQHIPPKHIDRAMAEIARVLGPAGSGILFEATKYAGQSDPSAHTIDRSSEFYARAMAPRKLVACTYISELDALAHLGSASPARLHVFAPPDSPLPAVSPEGP